MKKKFQKFVAVAAAASMIASLAACGNKNNDESTTTTATTANDESTTAQESSTDPKPTESDTPLVVGYSTFSQKFNPFYAESAYDVDAMEMTQIQLLTTDRMGKIILNGIDGETINYNGTDYTYKGPADLSIVRDEETNTTKYTAKIRDDLKFSDGQPVTADDIIFTYYVYLDNSYIGTTTLNSYDIVGYTNYKYNSSEAENVEVTQEDMAAFLADPSDEMIAYEKELISNTLMEEKDWCTENFASQNMKSAEEFFISLYNRAEAYDAAGKDYDTIVKEITEQYENDYKALATMYRGDETYFDSDIEAYAKELLLKDKISNVGGEPVDYISGIKKLDDYTVEVTLNGYSAPAVYHILGIYVTPLHYYGDTSKYDYENHKFGFDRGDLSSIQAKMTQPLGAGPYKFIEYKDKVIYYEANENYYLGEPKTKHVQFKEMVADEVASAVQTGTIDAGEMTGSKTRFEEVQGYNSNKDISGNVITTSKVDNLGYGYIGLNADTMNVGGAPDSEASKNLRKAFATILAVYRDVSIDSYYGEAANVIQYPISNTSWAAPQATDEGYQVAYSVDVEGNPIYTSDMDADTKYAAALDAAIGYLKAAGYTFDEASGKFTEAPAGAKLNYEVIIPADGSGDHPTFAVLTDAKEAFATIGIELDINDPADSNQLWDKLNAHTQEMWVAAWTSTIDPDMYQLYHSDNITGKGGTDSNNYGIADPALDVNIKDARGSDDQSYRKSIYKDCLDIILDWAVEIPVYQRQNCVIFSTERINMDTVTPDITTFYGWMAEIEKVEMK